ncbi:MAG TPA: ribonuclease D, partial [Candidatus Polarisedimenticolia bacterium]|nr:ribonuclease D [Candidatus Polarisedimenticolia bacterium]
MPTRRARAAYDWVDTAEGLAAAAKSLSKARTIGLDTEADSFYHYFHKCCLLQISDGERVFLVDVLAIRQPDALKEIFASERSTKILHAAEQDILYLRRDFGLEIHPVFDTMIAAQLLGKPSVGLAGLLSAYFGAKLDKGCQRDDWSKRPLTDRQKAYAAADVRQLIPLRDALLVELEATG